MRGMMRKAFGQFLTKTYLIVLGGYAANDFSAFHTFRESYVSIPEDQTRRIKWLLGAQIMLKAHIWPLVYCMSYARAKDVHVPDGIRGAFPYINWANKEGGTDSIKVLL